jgi:hypothetical protein
MDSEREAGEVRMVTEGMKQSIGEPRGDAPVVDVSLAGVQPRPRENLRAAAP